MTFGGLGMSAMAWLSREEMVALGWTLLHFCWQGTAVAMAYAVANQMTARATSKVRYAVPLAALMLMPVVVVGTFAVEMRTAAPAQVYRDTAQVISEAPLTVRPRPIVHELPLASSLEEPGDWLAMRAERLLPWVDGLWMAGVFLLALRSLGGWWQLELIRRRARRMVPQEVERAFRRICEQVHAGRQVVLRASDEVISPLAMGVWRATVILPISAVLGLPREELEAVMAHELGHIRRWDYMWNLLQTAVESVLFFHPAVWWLSRTVRDRREVCCDEIAVQSCAGAAVYARALLRLEEQRTVKLRLAMALGGCGGSLLGRVRKVLGEDMAMEGRMTSGVSVAAAGALVIALLLGPKVGEAVATPMVAAAQPVVAHVVAKLPRAMVSQIEKPNARMAAPPVAEAPEISAPSPRSESMPVVTPLPTPSPTPWFAPVAGIDVTPSPDVATALVKEMGFQEASGTGSSKGSAYLDEMRAAGYPLDLNNDLNELVALKSMGVTPEYAKAMGAAGLGKPTVHELIALKSMGVTPEYVTGLKGSGIAPKDFHEVVTEKSLGVTPEYAAEMKQKGFGDLSVHELVTMKSLGVTPEYAAEMKQKGFGDLSVHELVTMKSLGVTPEYAAAMKQKGFGDMSVHELISLKAQGMTPEYAGWLKQQFPQATTEELQRAAIFHLDDKFVADAKAHGFDSKNLDKLLRLKMSGLLDN
jgi:beta-lactamase regulating signal transducer with metallopeptidase domain